MTFKVGEKAYIVENHSYVTPVVILRSYGDFYTVAAGGAGINLRASRLFKTREDAERTLPEERKLLPARHMGAAKPHTTTWTITALTAYEEGRWNRMDEGERTIAIKCPCCSHRLFDMRTDTHGTIKIKCPRCKTVMAVMMKNRITVVPSK